MAVSSLHEDLLNLVRERPAFAVELAQLADVAVPRFGHAQLIDSTLNVTPLELHADKVVLLSDGKPVFGIVFEAQLQPDRRKEFTWPAYAAVARARNECPFVVVVVTTSLEVARWAATPVSLGCGTFRAIVLGPEQIPQITEPSQALAEPDLALLSVMAHGNGEVAMAVRIATAAAEILETEQVQQSHKRALYLGLIERALSTAARKIFQMLPETRRLYSETYYEGEAKGEARGQARGEAKALLKILAKRGLSVTDPQRTQIEACTDFELLDRWLDLALSVASVDDLLGS